MYLSDPVVEKLTPQTANHESWVGLSSKPDSGIPDFSEMLCSILTPSSGTSLIKDQLLNRAKFNDLPSALGIDTSNIVSFRNTQFDWLIDWLIDWLNVV